MSYDFSVYTEDPMKKAIKQFYKNTKRPFRWKRKYTVGLGALAGLIISIFTYL